MDSLTHTPPVCLTLTATGNTFQPKQVSFLPQITLGRDVVIFPATNQNEAVYQTLTVTNQSDNPVVYNMESGPATTGGMSVVSIKPSNGIISGKSDEIFVVRALPEQTKTYRQKLKINMNHNNQYTQVLNNCYRYICILLDKDTIFIRILKTFYLHSAHRVVVLRLVRFTFDFS